MATVQGFHDEIRAAPDDDGPRLVFSDWLDEHGEPERAEFIRLQCELARGVDDAARRQLLLRRERELLSAHEREWVGPLAAVVRRATFARGFVERVTVHAERLKKAAALFTTTPIRHLILLGMTDLAPLRKLPQLRQITTLDLREGCELSADGVGSIADSRPLAGVVHLLLRQLRMDEGPAEALAKSPALARLRTLDLYDAWWNVAPLPLLSHSPHLAGLTALILGGYELGLGDEVVSSFADPGCQLRLLRRLHLSYCEIGDAGARALAGSPHLASLERLDLTGNPIGRAGRKALRARFGERVRW